MPEDTNMVDNNATQGAPADEMVHMSQEKFNSVMASRLERQKAQLEKQFAEEHANYGEYKAKAARFDEIEEASKSELQKAVEERDRLKAELEKRDAERAHAEKVAKVAAEAGVDEKLLARMSGDVEENAEFLKAQMSATKYPSVPDHGEAKPPSAKPVEVPKIF